MRKMNAGWTDYASDPITVTEDGQFRFDWEEVARWNRRGQHKRIVIGYGLDAFRPDIPDRYPAALWIAITSARCTFQFITSYPARLRQFAEQWSDLRDERCTFENARGPTQVRQTHRSGRGRMFADYLDVLSEDTGGEPPPGCAWPCFDWAEGPRWFPRTPLRDLWIGVRVSGQNEVDERVPELLKTPADCRFLFADPMLGPLYLTSVGPDKFDTVDALSYLGNYTHREGFKDIPTLDLVIAGGQTGKDAKPLKVHWLRQLRDQCVRNHVPFFFRGWGDWLDWGHACWRYRSASHPPWKVRLDYFEDRRSYETISYWMGDSQGIARDKGAAIRVGKKLAGRILDGRTWEELPPPFRTTLLQPPPAGYPLGINAEATESTQERFNGRRP